MSSVGLLKSAFFLSFCVFGSSFRVLAVNFVQIAVVSCVINIHIIHYRRCHCSHF